jgi:hypothetical protein
LLPPRRVSWLVYVFLHRKIFVFYATNPSLITKTTHGATYVLSAGSLE